MIPGGLDHEVADGVAVIRVEGYSGGDLLAALLLTRRVLLARQDVYRLEVHLLSGDRPARHALHRAGFRLEGVLRGRRPGPTGRLDELCYGLLRDDDPDGPAGFSAVMNTVTARKRAIGHLLLTDPEGRVCVLETTFKPDWELPGGILEPGENPRQGVARELVEELSIEPVVGRLLAVDWLAPYLGWDDAIELVFDGGQVADPASLRPDGNEIRAAHWLPPAAAAERMAPFASGRLLAAVAARRTGSTCYLEAGSPVPDPS